MYTSVSTNFLEFDHGRPVWTPEYAIPLWLLLCFSNHPHFFSFLSLKFGYLKRFFSFRAGDVSISNIDDEKGNTNEVGRWFFRIENNQGTVSAREKCLAWHQWQRQILAYLDANFLKVFGILVPCPCQVWQAWRDGSFWFDTFNCAFSRRTAILRIPVGNQVIPVRLYQQCCYSADLSSLGALIIGLPDGGHLTMIFPQWFYKLTNELGIYSDSEAYDYCCVNSNECERFYKVRPSRDCRGYRPPPRSEPLLSFQWPKLI